MAEPTSGIMYCSVHVGKLLAARRHVMFTCVAARHTLWLCACRIPNTHKSWNRILYTNNQVAQSCPQCMHTYPLGMRAKMGAILRDWEVGPLCILYCE